MKSANPDVTGAHTSLPLHTHVRAAAGSHGWAQITGIRGVPSTRTQPKVLPGTVPAPAPDVQLQGSHWQAKEATSTWMLAHVSPG